MCDKAASPIILFDLTFTTNNARIDTVINHFHKPEAKTSLFLYLCYTTPLTHKRKLPIPICCTYSSSLSPLSLFCDNRSEAPHRT